MSPQEIDALRKEVKHKLIDLGLDRPGAYDLIVPKITLPASRNILSMAMTGYRNGKATQELLEELLKVLSSWPEPETDPCRGYIHEPEPQNK